MPRPIEPPVICSQSCGARAAGRRRRSRGPWSPLSSHDDRVLRAAARRAPAAMLSGVMAPRRQAPAAARRRGARLCARAPSASASASSAPVRSSSGGASTMDRAVLRRPAGSACRDRRRSATGGLAPTRMRCRTSGEHRERLVDRIGHALDRHAAGAALDARVGALRHQPRAGRRGDRGRRSRAPSLRAAPRPPSISSAGSPERSAPRRRAIASSATAPRAADRRQRREPRRPRSRRCRPAGSASRSGPAASARRRSPRRRRRRPSAALGDVRTQSETGRASALDVGGQRRVVAGGDRSRGRRRC